MQPRHVQAGSPHPMPPVMQGVDNVVHGARRQQQQTTRTKQGF